jgi:polar amino acid transport system substrate-binding protein
MRLIFLAFLVPQKYFPAFVNGKTSSAMVINQNTSKLILGITVIILLILFIVKKYVTYLKEKLYSNYQQLLRANQELAVAKENLQINYNELLDKQSALITSEERYRLAVETANDGLWDWDLQENKCYISERWKERLSLPESAIVNHYEVWLGQMHPEDEARVRQLVKDYLEGRTDKYYIEYRLRDAFDNYIWTLSIGKLIKDQFGNNLRMVGSHTDITERKEYEEKIYKMAYYDGLTNIPNRAYMIEKLDRAIKQSIELNVKGALFFLDLDNFKQINDTLGHDFGDQLLKTVSDRLMSYIGSDFIMARLGGDEFVILKEIITSKNEVEETARRIIHLFQNKWIVEENEMFVTVSMGSTIFPDDGKSVRKILKNADTAMYCAKDAGKNAYNVFDETMLETVLVRKEMEMDLRKAIECHEFTLFYQPYFKANTRDIAGIEALIRWFHPQKGLISPTEFIPIAEETGLITGIGEWIIREACRQNEEWQTKGYQKIAVAVNISTLQISHNSPQLLKNILSESGLEAKWLQIEITESEVMEIVEENILILNQIRESGIKILLDDFGTGYSSLSYLKKLPLDMVKIDRSFILDIESQEKEIVITEDIISIAHKLNLEVIAEGVETQEQVDYLLNHECDFLQGFFFIEPLCAEEMEGLLKNNLSL